MPSRILFVLKHREIPYSESECYSKTLSSGLLNSVGFVHRMLEDLNIESKVVQVIDNNCIDREITLYRPTHVIIEAYWVVPEKFNVLQKLHPEVRFIVRNHSESPFLATEGIAFEWTSEYLKRGVFVAANSPRMVRDLKSLAVGCGMDPTLIIYLPNYYHFENRIPRKPKTLPRSGIINVSCFGAIRVLKNHCLQALAAMKFADRHGLKLRFHINGTRVEGNSGTVLKNLRGIFKNSTHELVEHGWHDHDEFLQLISDQIDISMQVSLTETFNIVSADSILSGVPIVVSDEISWSINKFRTGNSNCIEAIVDTLESIYSSNFLCFFMKRQVKKLEKYNKNTSRIWFNIFGN